MPFTSSPMQCPTSCSTEQNSNLGLTLSPNFEMSADSSTPKMLKIDSLLNPSNDGSKINCEMPSNSPPSTPICIQSASAISSPPSRTPQTPLLIKRQKLTKDNAVYHRGTPKEPVNYLPFECTENSPFLSKQDQEDLARQHEIFDISPSGRGDQGFIADYQRHIPYSSEKKNFFGKTNRDAFEVFQYTFRVPGDPDRRKHVVMWDYQVGLVRITPFFKALKYSKTTPAKALMATPGLKELSHSITGGALAAQGYWMPYSCARAICLTFCYPIRWALTPIFGPSFIKECYSPGHTNYQRFKISAEIVRCAELEAQDMRSGENSREPTPNSDSSVYSTGTAKKIPRSVPLPDMPTLKCLRPHKEPPTFKLGSPFDSDSENSSENYYIHATRQSESPKLSPKSSNVICDGWTSINRQRITPMSLSPSDNTFVGSLSTSLLTEPRTMPLTSWRALEPTNGIPEAARLSADSQQENKRSHKRRISEHSSEEYYSDHSSESDDVDIPTTPVPRKRSRREVDLSPVARPLHIMTPSPTRTAKKSIKITTAEFRAARCLVDLSMLDSKQYPERKD